MLQVRSDLQRPHFIPPAIWRQFRLNTITDVFEKVAAAGGAARDIQALQEMQQLPRHMQCETFWAMLCLTRKMRTTDPRDKIYGLQGLVGNLIEPDYRRSTADVYIGVANLLSVKNLSQMLRWSGVGYDWSEKLSLPSSTPNWHDIAESKFSAVPDHHVCANRGLWSLAVGPVVEIHIGQGSVMTAAGFAVDTIRSVAPSQTNDNDLPEYFFKHLQDDGQFRHPKCSPEFRKYLLEFLRSDSGVEHYPSGIPLLQAVLRVVAWDHGRPDPPNHIFDPDSVHSQCALLNALRVVVPEAMAGGTLDRGSFTKSLGTILSIQFSEYYICEFLSQILPGTSIESCWNSPETAVAVLDEWENNNLGILILMQSKNLRIFRTDRGYLGYTLHKAQVGDLLCVLFDSSVPVVLRKREAGGYIHVGTSWVLGLNAGEAAGIVEADMIGMQTFEIR